MSSSITSRRTFLAASAGASLMALSPPVSLASLGRATPVTPDDMVKLELDIEPIVRLIESTPRDKCFAAVAEALRQGTTYRDLMAALFLAGIRNITSANTGGPLHAVFVMHSAHQMSLDAGPGDQWLPMFWALDNFKATQERGDRLETMKPFTGRPVAPENAVTEFHAAMDAWDADRAEAAMVSMLGGLGSHAIMEQLWQYGARDYRAIGHKAIYVANGWRTLQTIGWRHSGPALRHLARALVAYGPTNQGSGFTMDQQCYAGNLVRARENAAGLPADWMIGADQPEFVRELLAVIRTTDHDAACDLVIGQLKSGRANAVSVWNAIHLAAGEIVLRQASIRPVHAVTSSNAIHYAYNQSNDRQSRLFLLLQATGWLCHFIRFIGSQNRPFPDKPIDQLEAVPIAAEPEAAVPRVFEQITTDPDAAAAQAFTLARSEDLNRQYRQLARSLIFRKGDESHRYKFPAAVMEDIQLISPAWRPNFLAAATPYMCGSQLPDSPVMRRARAVLG